jgi:hypothetical protein
VTDVQRISNSVFIAHNPSNNEAPDGRATKMITQKMVEGILHNTRNPLKLIHIGK